jgi:hypothetical protein
VRRELFQTLAATRFPIVDAGVMLGKAKSLRRKSAELCVLPEARTTESIGIAQLIRLSI